MTSEEKSYIESALFLYRKVKLDKVTDYKDRFDISQIRNF